MKNTSPLTTLARQRARMKSTIGSPIDSLHWANPSQFTTACWWLENLVYLLTRALHVGQHWKSVCRSPGCPQNQVNRISIPSGTFLKPVGRDPYNLIQELLVGF